MRCAPGPAGAVRTQKVVIWPPKKPEVQILPNGRFARMLWTHRHAVDGKQHDGWHPGVPTKNGGPDPSKWTLRTNAVDAQTRRRWQTA
eukprot:gene17839-biopygen6865